MDLAWDETRQQAFLRANCPEFSVWIPVVGCEFELAEGELRLRYVFAPNAAENAVGSRGETWRSIRLLELIEKSSLRPNLRHSSGWAIRVVAASDRLQAWRASSSLLPQRNITRRRPRPVQLSQTK